MDARADVAEEFYTSVIDADERPFFVSDEATAFDICTLLEDELRGRIHAHYGVDLTAADLSVPLWELLDRLQGERTERKN